MEAMAHRNRWFTELKNGDFPWRTSTHNQMLFGNMGTSKNKNSWDQIHGITSNKYQQYDQTNMS